MKKLPNILFFLIIILVAVLLYLAFGGDPAITPENLPVDKIEKIEVKDYINDKTIVIEDKVKIKELLSLLYDSKPIKVDNPAISKGLYLIKLYDSIENIKTIKVSESKKVGQYHTLNTFEYKNDSFISMIQSNFLFKK
jgi:hypothetical protein